MSLPLGYRYAAVHAGIRQDPRDDLGLIVSAMPAAAAAVFTQNRVQAAPVALARRNLRASRATVGAILVNAGNANCATRTGDSAALACCRAVAKRLKLAPAQVMPASTGVIGVELDPRLILNALPRLFEGMSEMRFGDVARAILTTDTKPKEAFGQIALRRGTIRVAGMTKGAGMIHPRMATTLGFVLTDARLAPVQLRRILHRAIERSYNRISVDGDTSTNDTVALLANGCSGVGADPAEMGMVEEGISAVMESLACMIVRDGEGARKLVTIHISGASSNDAAARLARAIANSPLVKTAVAGADPNWGRVLCAAGNAGVAFDPRKVDIWMQDVPVCRSGLAADFVETELKRRLEQPECEIRFAIRGTGRGEARFWTCDLTEEYIRINASYRT